MSNMNYIELLKSNREDIIEVIEEKLNSFKGNYQMKEVMQFVADNEELFNKYYNPSLEEREFLHTNVQKAVYEMMTTYVLDILMPTMRGELCDSADAQRMAQRENFARR